MRAKIIACATVGEELEGLMPASMPSTLLEFGLHCTPEKLNATLQAEIDQTQEEVDTVLLGYGMCSKGALGLAARRFRLVIPRVDDCIALFLGSRDEYTKQCLKEPGTFYLTKGWIECGDDPYTEYLKARQRYGHQKAYWVEKRILANYTRVALIDTGNHDMEKYREYAKKMAEFFDLTFEEIAGSNSFLRRLVEGNWGDDFFVVEPGGRVKSEMFGFLG
jgi:hypothetical protein